LLPHVSLASENIRGTFNHDDSNLEISGNLAVRCSQKYTPRFSKSAKRVTVMFRRRRLLLLILLLLLLLLSSAVTD